MKKKKKPRDRKCEEKLKDRNKSGIKETIKTQ